MSQLTEAPETTAEQTQLAKLCVSIRGKLQFMDYLVRAAVADVDRFQEETDPGTRIFIRQLIEMHASNLALESENMRLIGELCGHLEAVVNGASAPVHQNGDAA
jgi:hypothetical protein